MNEERFSEEEVADILRRASQDVPAGSLTRQELLAAAQEAGIDSERIERAIAEPRPVEPLRERQNDREYIREFNFPLAERDLPIVLSELPPMAELKARQMGGLLTTFFEHRFVRYKVRITTDSASTRVEIKSDRSVQIGFSLLLGFLAMWAIMLASVWGMTTIEMIVLLIMIAPVASIPFFVIGRKVKAELAQMGKRVAERIQKLGMRA